MKIKVLILLSVMSITASAQAQDKAPDEKKAEKPKRGIFKIKEKEKKSALSIEEYDQAYWVKLNDLQKYDSRILAYDKNVIEVQEKLKEIKSKIHEDKSDKENNRFREDRRVDREELSVYLNHQYQVVNVNDTNKFKERSGKMCLIKTEHCYSYSEKNGKKILNLKPADLQKEIVHLKKAKDALETNKLRSIEDRNALIDYRHNKVNRVERAAKELNQAKLELVKKFRSGEISTLDYLNDPKMKDFLDFYQINPSDKDSVKKFVDAIEKHDFTKKNSGLFSGEFDEENKIYKELYESVYTLDPRAKSLEKVYRPRNIKENIQSEELVNVETPTTPVLVEESKPNIEELKPAQEDPTQNLKEEGDFVKNQSFKEKFKNSICPKESMKVTDPVIMECIKMGLTNRLLNPPLVVDQPEDEDMIEGEPALEEIDKPIENADSTTLKDVNCEEEAIKAMLKLFKDDKKNVLGKQFNLTVMKTALYLKEKTPAQTVPLSLEEFIHKEQKNLAKDDIIKQATELYKAHGIDKMGAGMDSFVQKIKDGKLNYYSVDKRMKNDEASQLMLLLSKSESKLGFGMEDAAIAWIASKANNAPPGTAKHNKLLISSQANKLLNFEIAGGTQMDRSVLEKRSKELEAEIAHEIQGSIASIEADCPNLCDEAKSHIKEKAFAGLVRDIIDNSGQREKLLGDYYLDVKEFIGKPSHQDFIEFGKKVFTQLGSPFTSLANDKAYLAAGQAHYYKKSQLFKGTDGACYEITSEKTQFKVKGAVGCQ